MKEVGYNLTELSKLKYVKIIYTGLDNHLHEIRTEVKTLEEKSISLRFRYKENFDIQYPQNVIIKFVADSGMYIAKSVLQEIKKVNDYVYFTVLPPKKMVKRQERKYYRINLKQTCIFVATDEEFHSTVFLSQIVDISAGGILIHKLQSMFDSRCVRINVDGFKYFNIILFLETDTVLKLSARYVRQEIADESYRYAFEFTKMTQSDINTISKFVTKKQIEQLKIQQNLKD